MSPAEWAGFGAGVMAVLSGGLIGLRFLVKGWLSELKPNSRYGIYQGNTRFDLYENLRLRKFRKYGINLYSCLSNIWWLILKLLLWLPMHLLNRSFISGERPAI